MRKLEHREGTTWLLVADLGFESWSVSLQCDLKPLKEMVGKCDADYLDFFFFNPQKEVFAQDIHQKIRLSFIL